MRVVAAVLLVCVSLAAAADSDEAGPYASPIIVSDLSKAMAKPAGGGEPENKHPLPYPNNDQHPYVSQLGDIQLAIEKHGKEMEELQKHLDEAKKHREKLLQAQKLAHAMVSLHQSENVLALIDKRVEELKKKIKKIGEDAEDLAREREDLKRQMEDALDGDDDKLQGIKKELKRLGSLLDAMCSKREEVATVVGEWRGFVNNLRAAHGLPPHTGGAGMGLTLSRLPKPPSAEQQQQQEEDEEDSEVEEKKSKLAAKIGKQKAKADKLEARIEAITDGDITAKPHEIAKTAAAIDELLSVHVPKVTGKAMSLIETEAAAVESRVRRNRNRA